MHFVAFKLCDKYTVRSICSAAVFKFDKLRCKVVGVGWKRSTVRVCDSPSYLRKTCGWLACDSKAPTDTTSDTLDCLHITSKLRSNIFFLNPALDACQQKGQTAVFTLFQIVLFCLKWVGSLYFFQNRLNPSVPRVFIRESTWGQQKNYTFYWIV